MHYSVRTMGSLIARFSNLFINSIEIKVDLKLGLHVAKNYSPRIQRFLFVYNTKVERRKFLFLDVLKKQKVKSR